MRRYGLIGRPLGHSFSARYFAEKFRREEIADCRYDLFELPEIDRLPELLAACSELCGFNVTIPYKRSVFDFLQEVSDEARRIGAVNCVRCDGGRLAGYNTDIEGIRLSLSMLLQGADASWREYLHGECTHTFFAANRTRPADNRRNLYYEAGSQYLTDGKTKYIWHITSGTEQLFDVQNKRFTTVSCTNCGYTELYRMDADNVMDVLDFLFSG